MPFYVEPTAEQLASFGALPVDEPFQVLNLVRFRDVAAYPADHPNAADGLSGAEAYGRYLAATAPLFEDAGGKMIWRGKPDAVLVGPPANRWDAAFIVEYPSATAFMAEAGSPEYGKAAAHRFAAVLDQVAIRCAPMAAGATLG